MQLSLSVFVRAASVAATLFLAAAAPVPHGVPVLYPRSSGVDSHGQTLASQVMHLVTGSDDLNAQSADLLQARGRFKPISELMGEVQGASVDEAVKEVELPQFSSEPLTASVASGSEEGAVAREDEELQPDPAAASLPSDIPVASTSGPKKRGPKPRDKASLATRDKASLKAIERRRYVRRIGEPGIPLKFSRKEWEDAQIVRKNSLPRKFDPAAVRRRQLSWQRKNGGVEQSMLASTSNEERVKVAPSSTSASSQPPPTSSSGQPGHSSEPAISPPRRPARKLFYGAWETGLDMASKLRVKPPIPRKRKAEPRLPEEAAEQERLRNVQRRRESRLREKIRSTGPQGIEKDLFSEQQWLDALKVGKTDRQTIGNDARRVSKREWARKSRKAKAEAKTKAAAHVEAQDASQSVPSSVPESDVPSTLRDDSLIGDEVNRQTNLVPVQVERISPLKIKVKLNTRQPQS